MGIGGAVATQEFRTEDLRYNTFASGVSIECWHPHDPCSGFSLL